MAQRKTLTENQISVLRWIGVGCPDGPVTDEFRKISVGALRDRGLVTTEGTGPKWSAGITKAGRDYLAEVDKRTHRSLAAVTSRLPNVSSRT